MKISHVRAIALVHLLVTSALSSSFAGCFSAEIADVPRISCGAGRDCPAGFFCLFDTGICVLSDDPCVETFENGIADPAPDGTPCDGDKFCIRGTCVEPLCGDGTVTGSESCDSTEGCRDDCTSCGDGRLDAAEACDDGAANSDTEASACRLDCTDSFCGDGIIDLDESCDGADECRSDCSLCGDGITNGDEECDDGVDNSDTEVDACRIACVLASCGDGVVDSLEVCDDQVSCNDTCTKVAECGDRVVDSNEDCDDGNGNAVDGCDRCTFRLWEAELLVTGKTFTDRIVTRPQGVVIDRGGRALIATGTRILRMNDDGSLTRVIGTDNRGGDGDGGRASSARLREPRGMAFDAAGRLLIADAGDNRIRRVGTDGTISTVAGQVQPGFAGDGFVAVSAQLFAPSDVAVGGDGSIYIADTGNHRIRRITAGIITTFAGTGTAGFGGDGDAATAALLNEPRGIAFDDDGALLVADSANHRVRRVDLAGIITTVIGTGVASNSGDNGAAAAAQLNGPIGLDVGSSGDIFITTLGNAVRRVGTDGIISTVAGTNVAGDIGDGAAATLAQVRAPGGVAVLPSGDFLIADTGNDRVRRVTSGRIETVTEIGLAPAPQRATSLFLGRTQDVAIDAAAGVTYLAESTGAIWRITSDGLATIHATLPGSAAGLDIDAGGVLFAVDDVSNRVFRVDRNGVVSVVAGSGTAGFSGDGGQATLARLDHPVDVAVAVNGTLFVSDQFNHRIRRIDPAGVITTFAGNGSIGFSGDGGAATRASFGNIKGIAIDAVGRVFVADKSRHVVRMIDVTGLISTVAGGGFGGDGEQAVGARVDGPWGVALSAGRLFIASSDEHQVRLVEPNGVISTVAGIGLGAFDGPGDEARFNIAAGLTVASDGGLLVADQANRRLRHIDATGFVTTVAGDVHPPGLGIGADAHLYPSRALIAHNGNIVSVGELGRALVWNGAELQVAVGYPQSSGSGSSAQFAPALRDARGVAYDPTNDTLVMTEAGTGDLRIIGPASQPFEDWQSTSLPTSLVTPSGIGFDATNLDAPFIVVEEGRHCVQRLSRAGTLSPVFGNCGIAGSGSNSLSSPSHVTVSSSGIIYIADSGNNRVWRASNSGTVLAMTDLEAAPRQMALDAAGNLFVAATTSVLMLANVDGDADADIDDLVVTIFGDDTSNYPASEASCLGSLALDLDGAVYVADACAGFLIRLTVTDPS